MKKKNFLDEEDEDETKEREAKKLKFVVKDLEPLDVVENMNELSSYRFMREEMVKIISNARGQKRIHLQNVLNVLDICADNATRGHNDFEDKVYSILS